MILLLNSALWDVLSDQAAASAPASSSAEMDDPWADHVEALRRYLTGAQQMYRRRGNNNNDNVTVAWLLPTAVHIHRVYRADDPRTEERAPQKIHRCRYMSASRTRQLYERQVQVCRSLSRRRRIMESTTTAA